MTIVSQRMFGRCAVGVGLVAAVLLMSGRNSPVRAERTQSARSIVAQWPEPSRFAARAMIGKYGRPDRRDKESLTWLGLYRGRKTVLHRSDSGEGMVEQVVTYRVPAEKVGALELFDDRIKVDRNASELSARTESARTNFLILNLAHEIASGFKTVGQAQAFRDKEMRLADAGKSSRYRDGLLFEQPLAVRPGVSVLPGGPNSP